MARQLFNTGVEILKTAIKFCRKWANEVKGISADNAKIFVYESNFHRKTVNVISFSSNTTKKIIFGHLFQAIYQYLTMNFRFWKKLCN